MEGDRPDTTGAPIRHRAQSLVELGFILPIVCLLLVGVVDLGRAFYESVAIHSAAEAGALKALSYSRGVPVPADGDRAVRDAIIASTNPDIFPYLQITDADIDTSTIQWTANSPYTITVTRQFRLLTPMLGRVFGAQAITLRAVASGTQNCAMSC